MRGYGTLGAVVGAGDAGSAIVASAAGVVGAAGEVGASLLVRRVSTSTRAITRRTTPSHCQKFSLIVLSRVEVLVVGHRLPRDEACYAACRAIVLAASAFATVTPSAGGL
jgi:hypothetical protein